MFYYCRTSSFLNLVLFGKGIVHKVNDEKNEWYKNKEARIRTRTKKNFRLLSITQRLCKQGQSQINWKWWYIEKISSLSRATSCCSLVLSQNNIFFTWKLFIFQAFKPYFMHVLCISNENLFLLTSVNNNWMGKAFFLYSCLLLLKGRKKVRDACNMIWL